MTLKELLGEAYKEGLTIEEVEAAIKDVSFPADNSLEIEKLKNALSKANSEAADNKRKLRETLSEAEQKEQAEAERVAKLEADYTKLLHETNVAKHKGSYLALGYDETLAEETAEAMINGDFAKVLANQQKHQSNLEKKIKADVLKDTPRPAGGSGVEKMTLEKLRAMPPDEQIKFSAENPDEYRTLYEGGN